MHVSVDVDELAEARKRRLAAEAKAKAEADASAWRENLIYEYGKDGKPRPVKHTENAVVILRFHPEWKGRIRLDAYSRTVTVTDPPWHSSDRPTDYGGTRPWQDADSVRLSAWIRREERIDISIDACDRAVEVAAEANAYHPVLEYFGQLSWDYTPRLSSAPETYFGAAPSLYTSLVFRWWMTAAVARTYRPGCKADNVLILEGAQGLRKSTALRTLAGSAWFTDTPIDLHSKDAFLSLGGKLIVELAELESLRRADASRAKSFFTSPTDTFRPPYGKRMVTVPRTCVFAGTVNHDSYLQDSTGNRRYWPIACAAIDVDAIARDRDQLWAEAVALYLGGASWWPASDEERAACDAAQEPRAEGDAWEDLIRAYVARQDTTCVPDVLAVALNLDPSKWDRSAQMRAAAVLKSLGWEKYRDSGHARQWRYRRARSRQGNSE